MRMRIDMGAKMPKSEFMLMHNDDSGNMRMRMTPVVMVRFEKSSFLLLKIKIHFL